MNIFNTFAYFSYQAMKSSGIWGLLIVLILASLFSYSEYKNKKRIYMNYRGCTDKYISEPARKSMMRKNLYYCIFYASCIFTFIAGGIAASYLYFF